MVSENAAASAAVSSVVEGLLAREEEEERREESLQNTATRLAEDLAQVILNNQQLDLTQILKLMLTFQKSTSHLNLSQSLRRHVN